MTVSAFLAPNAKFQAFDNLGNFLVGGLLNTYQAGTVIPIATWTDWTATTPNPNPVVLDSRGSASVYLLPNVAYKFTLTDSSGNLIWTVDEILNSQVLTLFGGVDTGGPNAYVITFVANFSAYTNGIVIYFIPANTNTSGSTLNVNGIGVVNIVNPNGNALVAGQIIAGQPAEVLYYNGSWILLNNTVKSGSFTATLTGFTTTVTGTIQWRQSSQIVTLFAEAQISGTSNVDTFGLMGIPASIQPAAALPVSGADGYGLSGLNWNYLNSTTALGMTQLISASSLSFYIYTATSSQLPFSNTAWTSSNFKGLLPGWSFSYPLL